MTKQKTRKTAAAEPVIIEPEPEETPAELVRFTAGSWRGMPTWACTACPFDTMEGEEVILKHYQDQHETRRGTRKYLLPLLDRHGNQIEREVIEDG